MQKKSKQYTCDKDMRVGFRANPVMASWLRARAEKLGVSCSEFCRALVFQVMSAEETFGAIEAKGNTDKLPVATAAVMEGARKTRK